MSAPTAQEARSRRPAPARSTGGGSGRSRAAAAEFLWAGALTWVLTVTASVGFVQVFRTGDWIPTAVMGITVASAAVMAGRTLGLSTPWNAVASGMVGVAWLTWWWPLGRGLPLSDRISALLAGRDLAVVAIAEQVAPAEAVPGLVLAVTAGATLVALLIGLAMQARRPGVAALLAVALWAGPAAVEVPEPASSATGLGVLLAAGVALATIHRSPPHLTVTDLGRGLGITTVAVVVAVVVAPQVPWYGESAMIDVRSLGLRGASAQPIVDVGDQLRLPAPRQVALVRTNSPTYMRTAALDVFDGTTWRAGTSPNQPWDPDAGSESATGPLIQSRAPRSVTSRWEVTTYALPAVWLPIPNQPDSVVPAADDQRIRFNRVGEVAFVDDIGALEASTDVGPDYIAIATVPTPTVDDLRAAGPARDMEDFTLLPAGLHEDVLATADEVVAAAGATFAIDQALALVEWFSGPDSDFGYSTDVPGLRGADALSEFVNTTQLGYCEYYATALAVMLRGLRIPARVATGYLPGSEISSPDDGGRGMYSISTTDAHAWVEVAFAGWGWVTFDATPRSDTARLRPDDGRLVAFGANGALGQVPAAPPSDDIPRPDQLVPEAPVSPAPTQVAVPGAGIGGQAGGAGGALALAVVGVAVAGVVLLRRRLGVDRSAPPAAQVEARLGHLLGAARRLGPARDRAETLHEVMRRWREDHALDGAATRVVTSVATTALYSARTPSSADLADLERASRTLRAQLRAQAVTSRRLFDRVVGWFEG